MIRFCNYLPIVAVLVGAAILAMPTQAMATYTVTLAEAGFTTVTSGNLTSGGVSNTFGPMTIGQYTVTVTTSDSAPGISNAFGGALLTQNTFSVTAATAPTANLVITVQDTSFTNNLGNPVRVSNSLSTTAISAGVVTANTFVNLTTNATSNASLTGPTLSGSSVTNAMLGTDGGTTFTLGNVSTVMNLGANNTDNFTVTSLATPVPEPASMVTLLTALPVLGLNYWRRRRQVRL